MLENLLQLKKKENALNEFISCVRQGIPSAVFGVTDAFKNFMVSALDEKVLYVVKDGLTARAAVDAIKEISGKTAVYIPPKDEILLHSRAFSKDNTYARINAFANLEKASPSSHSKSLCSKKCAIPSGTVRVSPPIEKQLSIEPYLVPKIAYDELYVDLFNT